MDRNIHSSPTALSPGHRGQAGRRLGPGVGRTRHPRRRGRGRVPAGVQGMRRAARARGRRADEAIVLLRRLWSGEEISHDGPFFPMTDVRIHPPPAQPGGPPIVVAGRKDPAMRRAASVGDGWMPYLYSPLPIRRFGFPNPADRRRGGTGPAIVRVVAFVFVNIDRDGRRARQEAARMMGGTYDQDFVPMVDKVAAAGTSDEVTEKIDNSSPPGYATSSFCRQRHERRTSTQPCGL